MSRQNSISMMENNIKQLGPLSNEEFLAVKARVCGRRLIHANSIGEIQRMNWTGMFEPIKMSAIAAGDSIKIKATVSSMLGGPEKTGWVELNDIQDIKSDDYMNMLVIDTSKYIFTTLNCKDAMYILDAVIQGNNWVDINTLGEMINAESYLSDFQKVLSKDGPELGIDISQFPELF